MAFGQIFQRVGQFPGHGSQRTVGTCPCLLDRMLAFTSLSSYPVPDKASPLFRPQSSPSSALKGSPERRGAYVTNAIPGRQGVVDTPFAYCFRNQARLSPPWKGTGALSHSEEHCKERFHGPMGIHLAIKKEKQDKQTLRLRVGLYPSGWRKPS